MPTEQAVCNLSAMRIIYGMNATNKYGFYDRNESYIVNPKLIPFFNLNLFVPSLFFPLFLFFPHFLPRSVSVHTNKQKQSGAVYVVVKKQRDRSLWSQ